MIQKEVRDPLIFCLNYYLFRPKVLDDPCKCLFASVLKRAMVDYIDGIGLKEEVKSLSGVYHAWLDRHKDVVDVGDGCDIMGSDFQWVSDELRKLIRQSRKRYMDVKRIYDDATGARDWIYEDVLGERQDPRPTFLYICEVLDLSPGAIRNLINSQSRKQIKEIVERFHLRYRARGSRGSSEGHPGLYESTWATGP